MQKIKVLHIAKIDNNKSKGTSVIIPHYIIEQNKNSNISVCFLNCNSIRITFDNNFGSSFIISENSDMRIIKTFKPDIVVFHELYKIEYIKLYKFLKEANIPYIIIPHGGMSKMVQNTRKFKKIVGNYLLFNDFFKNAVLIQYLSENEKNNSCFLKYDYYILGSGIDIISSKNLYLTYSHDYNETKFVYVGRYDYLIKGLDQLLLAFKKIKNSGIKNIKLFLYGTGDRKTIKMMNEFIGKNNLQNIVFLNGPVFDENKRNVICSNDFFIQVSRTEGQPVGVMEALSLGMPVILSEGTGFKKIIDDNKIGYCTTTNSDVIFDVIIKASNCKDNISFLSNNSYNFSLKNYSWNSIVDDTISIYRQILKKWKG